MALYPLCDHKRQPREAITYAVGAIEAKLAALNERGTFLTLLGIFGQLAHPTLDVRQIIGVEKMKESKFYQEIMQEGEVVAIGKGKRDDKGEVHALDVKLGDRILFGQYSGSDIKMDGQEYLIMREDEILGIFEK